MNPYEKYQQQVVATMTQGEMLLKLYDETIRQIGLARVCIQEGRVAEMDAALTKAEKIVLYLRSTLDQRYPISKSLSQLYDFFHNQLVMASIKKDTGLLDDVEPLVCELRETFDECAKIDRATRTNVAVANTV